MRSTSVEMTDATRVEGRRARRLESAAARYEPRIALSLKSLSAHFRCLVDGRRRFSGNSSVESVRRRPRVRWRRRRDDESSMTMTGGLRGVDRSRVEPISGRAS